MGVFAHGMACLQGAWRLPLPRIAHGEAEDSAVCLGLCAPWRLSLQRHIEKKKREKRYARIGIRDTDGILLQSFSVRINHLMEGLSDA